MYIFKQPRIGGKVTCHQDSTFLYTEPTDIVGLWFALEDATIENGCLWAIPGGHKAGLKTRWVRAEEGMRFDDLDLTPFAEEKLVPLEVPKGTLILLSGLLPHKIWLTALPNLVISGNSVYPASNWLQRSLGMPLRGFE
jgi:phytanoyl-CoA hydroxylase